MIRGMTGTHGDERAAPRGANFPARHEFDFDDGAIFLRFDGARHEQDGRI